MKTVATAKLFKHGGSQAMRLTAGQTVCLV